MVNRRTTNFQGSEFEYEIPQLFTSIGKFLATNYLTQSTILDYAKT
jgi:hypothetical protein